MRWCPYTCQKRSNLLPLSFKHLSSLDPSSNYLTITVKIKEASPINLFNLYVPAIHSSCDSHPKLSSPFLLPSSPTTYIFSNFSCHHSSWDSHSPKNQLGKDLFDWLLSSNLLPLNNLDHPTLLHHATGNCSSPDGNSSSCPHSLQMYIADLSSDHLPISMTIPTSPLINFISHSPSFNYNKAHWEEYFFYTDTHCPTSL